MKGIDDLRGRHPGERCYIVGKGPSLLKVTAAHFGAGPVIALNHSIEHIRRLELPNPIYTMQKDGALVRPKLPERLIVTTVESKDAWPRYRERYMIDVRRDLGLRWDEWSLPCATVVAKLMGCRAVSFIAFDGVTTGDSRLVVGTEAVPTPAHFLRYYRRAGAIAGRLARGMRVRWVTPS